MRKEFEEFEEEEEYPSPSGPLASKTDSGIPLGKCEKIVQVKTLKDVENLPSFLSDKEIDEHIDKIMDTETIWVRPITLYTLANRVIYNAYPELRNSNNSVNEVTEERNKRVGKIAEQARNKFKIPGKTKSNIIPGKVFFTTIEDLVKYDILFRERIIKLIESLEYRKTDDIKYDEILENEETSENKINEEQNELGSPNESSDKVENIPKINFQLPSKKEFMERHNNQSVPVDERGYPDLAKICTANNNVTCYLKDKEVDTKANLDNIVKIEKRKDDITSKHNYKFNTDVRPNLTNLNTEIVKTHTLNIPDQDVVVPVIIPIINSMNIKNYIQNTSENEKKLSQIKAEKFSKDYYRLYDELNRLRNLWIHSTKNRRMLNKEVQYHFNNISTVKYKDIERPPKLGEINLCNFIATECKVNSKYRVSPSKLLDSYNGYRLKNGIPDKINKNKFAVMMRETYPQFRESKAYGSKFYLGILPLGIDDAGLNRKPKYIFDNTCLKHFFMNAFKIDEKTYNYLERSGAIKVSHDKTNTHQLDYAKAFYKCLSNVNTFIITRGEKLLRRLEIHLGELGSVLPENTLNGSMRVEYFEEIEFLCNIKFPCITVDIFKEIQLNELIMFKPYFYIGERPKDTEIRSIIYEQTAAVFFTLSKYVNSSVKNEYLKKAEEFYKARNTVIEASLIHWWMCDEDEERENMEKCLRGIKMLL